MTKLYRKLQTDILYILFRETMNHSFLFTFPVIFCVAMPKWLIGWDYFTIYSDLMTDLMSDVIFFDKLGKRFLFTAPILQGH